jgi:large subunit ribosomal protein L15
MKQLVSHFPKVRGFRSLAPKSETVSIDRLMKFQNGSLVTPDRLVIDRLVLPNRLVKIIGSEKLDRALTVKAHAFSSGARRAITEAGGSAVVLPIRKRPLPRRRTETRPPKA